jgi:hypothetical protein
MLRRTLAAVLLVALCAPLTAQQIRPRWATVASEPGSGGEGGDPSEIVVTELLAEGDTTNGVSYTSSAFSVSTGDRGYCAVINNDESGGGDDGADEPLSLTQTGQTWTAV